MSVSAEGSGVYVAVYSGIQVYEMECRGIAVMKRHADSWLNATQILKVAGVDKGRRTKILEREVLTGEHEKIQGGYGKYQGTWVPNARGVELCRHYMVHEIMRPILEYDPTASGTQPDQTPTKAELKKLLKSSQKTTQRAGSSSQSSGLKRERSEQLASVGGSKRLKAVISSAATSPLHSDGASVAGAPRGGSVGLAARLVAPVPGINAAAGYSSPAGVWEEASSQTVGESAGDIRAKHDRGLLMNIFLNDDPNYVPDWLLQTDVSAPQSPIHDSDLPLSAVLTAVTGKTPKVDVDLMIDDQGHTAVHWAATLARIQVLDLLLFQGADARILNFEGESALVRAVQVTNNYDSQSFPDLLELLHDTIPLTDRHNRTVLHHIAIATGTKGRERAARYYADCLLSWIVRLAGGYQVDHSLADEKALPLDSLRNLPTPTQSSSPGTRRGPSDALDSEAELLGAGSVDPARNADFVAFLNLQDTNGDTALNLAARYGDRAVIRMILNAGASPSIPNIGGLCPLHFGVGELVESGAPSSAYVDDEHPVSNSPTPAARHPLSRAPLLNLLSPSSGVLALPQTPSRLAAVRGSGRGLLSSPAQAASGRMPNGSAIPVAGSGDAWSPASAELRMHQSVQSIQQIMSELEADFSGEMRIKQEHFDSIKRQLRNTTTELVKARDTIHQLHAKAEQLEGVKSRVVYLEETLARETIAVRTAIAALPPNSKPRLGLEAMLDSLLAGSGDDTEADAGLSLVPSVVLDGLPSDAEVDKTSDPARLAALVEQMRVVNQVYAKRDALLRERVAVLRRRADVSERERQYRQIIASCCEISEADVDIWIDRLVSAVESTEPIADDGFLPPPATVNGTAPHTLEHAPQAG
ncbi:transcriptional regulator swi6 [Coemansia sp. RSA 2050]|nr:transcriptional regulator swi6 [Coemansia sp. RSA 2050]KAJ2736678.1 transcriptional regulator swi6 [Coemansia sp. BCRC 34962]